MIQTMGLAAIALLLFVSQRGDGDVMEVARHHHWTVIVEKADTSVAVMSDPMPDDDRGRRPMSVIFTQAAPLTGADGSQTRQVHGTFVVDCTAGTYAPVRTWSADPASPPRDYVPRSPSEHPPSDPPVIMIAPAPLVLTRPSLGTVAVAMIAVACGRAAAEHPVIEGDWNAVLTTLLARNDALRQLPVPASRG